MLQYCEYCEEDVEPFEGRCPNCNEPMELKEKRAVFDEWEDEDNSDWGAEENDYFTGYFEEGGGK